MAGIRLFFGEAAYGAKPSVNISLHADGIHSSEPQYERARLCRDQQHAIEQTRECTGNYARGWCCDDCGTQFHQNDRALREHCETCSIDRCEPCAQKQRAAADAAAPGAEG